jgi:hypothetical protein
MWLVARWRDFEFYDAAPLVCVAINAHVSQINVLLIAMVIIAFWYYVSYLTTGTYCTFKDSSSFTYGK